MSPCLRSGSVRSLRSGGAVRRRDARTKCPLGDRVRRQARLRYARTQRSKLRGPRANADTAKEDTADTYETREKNVFRGFVLADWNFEPPPARIVYLDSAHGGATRFFLSRGLTARDLLPVNRDPECVASITRTGVRATCGDIFDVVGAVPPTRRDVVWLDLEQNAIETRDLECVVSHAAVVHLTLSCRGTQPTTVLRRAAAQLHRCGLRHGVASIYPSKSGTGRMVHLRYRRA
jgi:hypothetical protein